MTADRHTLYHSSDLQIPEAVLKAGRLVLMIAGPGDADDFDHVEVALLAVQVHEIGRAVLRRESLEPISLIGPIAPPAGAQEAVDGKSGTSEPPEVATEAESDEKPVPDKPEPPKPPAEPPRYPTGYSVRLRPHESLHEQYRGRDAVLLEDVYDGDSHVKVTVDKDGKGDYADLAVPFEMIDWEPEGPDGPTTEKMFPPKKPKRKPRKKTE